MTSYNVRAASHLFNVPVSAIEDAIEKDELAHDVDACGGVWIEGYSMESFSSQYHQSEYLKMKHADLKKYRLVWRDGSTNVTPPAASIEEAFALAGFGAGAARALDYFEEVE